MVQVQVTSPDTKKVSPSTVATDVSLGIEHVIPRSALDYMKKSMWRHGNAEIENI